MPEQLFLYRCVVCGCRLYRTEKLYSGQTGQSRHNAATRVAISNSSFREPCYDQSGKGYTKLKRITTCTNVSCDRRPSEDVEYFGKQTAIEHID